MDRSSVDDVVRLKASMLKEILKSDLDFELKRSLDELGLDGSSTSQR
jgi:hypothetical protein